LSLSAKVAYSISGSINSTSNLSGSTKVFRELIGSINSTSSFIAKLGYYHDINSSIIGTSNIAGALLFSTSLTGVVFSTSSLSGTLNTKIALNGNISVITAASSIATLVLGSYSTSVRYESSPAAKIGDIWVGQCFHPSHIPSPIPMTGSIIGGSSDVFVIGGQSARFGDLVIGNCGHIGRIITAAGTIEINGLMAARKGDLTSDFEVGVII